MGGPILGGLVDRLAVERPEVQLTTYTSHYADELAAMVLSGRLDLALVGVCGNAGPPPVSGLVWREGGGGGGGVGDAARGPPVRRVAGGRAGRPGGRRLGRPSR